MQGLIESLQKIVSSLPKCPIGNEATYDAWEESKHPRGKGGKFAKTSGGGSLEEKAPEGANPNQRSDIASYHGEKDIKKTYASSSVKDWMSQNAEWRLRQGWTFSPKGVTTEELNALAALVPEKHHFGSESHGSDVVLMNMYPPNYERSPEVRFVKQFGNNVEDLGNIRKGLFLMYGGYGSKDYFRKYVDSYGFSEYEDNRTPSRQVVDAAKDVQQEKESFEKAHGKLTQKELEEQERLVYAKRQKLQKDIGYPMYHDSDEWKKADKEYREYRAYRIGDSDAVRKLESLRARERNLARKEWDSEFNKRYEAYRAERRDRGIKMLNEVADRRQVKRFDEIE